jgi:hypothetical protein
VQSSKHGGNYGNYNIYRNFPLSWAKCEYSGIFVTETTVDTQSWQTLEHYLQRYPPCPISKKLIHKADKKAESRGGFFGGGGSSKFEEAAELYTQAANAFRLQKLGTHLPHPNPPSFTT